MRSKILLIDDDIAFFKQLELALAAYDMEHAKNSRQAGIMLANHNFDLILLDLNLNERNPEFEGLNYLRTIRQKHPLVPIIVLSKHAGYKEVSQAMSNGALSFFNKNDQVLLDWRNKIQQAIANKRLLELNYPFIGQSDAFETIKQQLNNFDGKVKRPILILGPSGVGKETAARYFHNQSDNRYYEFLEIDLSTFEEDEFEAEITHALKTCKRGTLFVRNLPKYDATAQHWLTEVCKAVRGESDIFKWNGQIIASSNEDLLELLENNAFDSELYYQFELVKFPALYTRKADIEALLKYFARKRGVRNIDKVLEREAKSYLLNYDYPFNVKQLKNFVETMFLNMERQRKSMIDVQCLPNEVVTKSYDSDQFQLHELDKAIAYTELDFIDRALRASFGARGKAAQLLNIKNDDNLRNRILKYYRKFPDLVAQFSQIKESYPKIVKTKS
ncbi:MAG: sigma-54-dependent transcriptional regulator [Flammeovirgaceae bacterium]